MIEKMKMVHVVTTVSHKNDMLDGLRDLGLLHLAEKQSADPAAIERFTRLSKLSGQLLDYAPGQKSKDKETKPVLSDKEFSVLFAEAEEAMEKKGEISQEISHASAEIDRIHAWGDFSPSEIRKLAELGIDLHFYRVTKDACEQIMKDPDIKAIRLTSIEKQDTLAVIGSLPSEIPATEFNLPEKGISELEAEIRKLEEEQNQCEENLRNAALYENSFQDQMLKAQNAQNYSAASQTAKSEEELVWLAGYIPEVDLEGFKTKAAEEHWAYAVEDVAEDDEAIPTKLRYNKVTRLLSPLYDMLGILPGYREADITLFFLMFFILFFAMIMGDGGYGCILLLAAIGITIKTKKVGTPIFLMYVLSIATIVWGAITGTWFGMESAMKVPFLKAMTLPGFANYPEYFGLTSAGNQNNIMKFSFTLGAIQMELGSLLSVKRKLSEKNLSFMADIGWMISIVSMYLLSLYLVIGQELSIKPVFVAIGIGFVLVILFSGQAPGKKFSDGLKSGLGGAFTTFLDTISCFGNVMSYIRLFAVGMAGLAISQSFNSMAAGMAHGPMLILAAIVVIIGHVLNLVMCILSVVVHGVRLNVLEFSGQVGLEWTGTAYDPFKVNEKIKN